MVCEWHWKDDGVPGFDGVGGSGGMFKEVSLDGENERSQLYCALARSGEAAGVLA